MIAIDTLLLHVGKSGSLIKSGSHGVESGNVGYIYLFHSFHHLIIFRAFVMLRNAVTVLILEESIGTLIII